MAYEGKHEIQLSEEYVLEKLVPESPFHAFHGMAFDLQNQLYVASLFEQTIYRVDVDSGNVEVFIGSPMGQADDLVFSPDGTVYWTALLSGEIRVKKEGGSPSVLVSGYPGTDPITINKKGQVFFAQSFLGDKLFELDPDGKKTPRQILDKPEGLNAFAFGNDGWLYSPQMHDGLIIRMNVHNGQVETITSGLYLPTAVKFNSKGQLFGVDTFGGFVFQIEDVIKGDKKIIARINPGLDNLAIDSNDQLYVSSFVEKAVYQVDVDSGDIKKIIEAVSPQGKGLTTPCGIALYEDQNETTLYVADLFAYRVLDAMTGEQKEMHRSFVTPLILSTSISANEKHVIISDWFAGEIHILDRITSKFLSTIKGLNYPYGTVELPDGSLLVADCGAGQVIRILDQAGQKNRIVLQDNMSTPTGLTITKDEQQVFVTETGSGVLSSIEIANGNRKIVASDLDMPEGIALHPDGKIILAEVGKKRLLAIDPVTGRRETIAWNLPIGLPGYAEGPLPFIPTDVAVSCFGHIYISTNTNNAIYRIDRKI